jgi:hypothetical protein
VPDHHIISSWVDRMWDSVTVDTSVNEAYFANIVDLCRRAPAVEARLDTVVMVEDFLAAIIFTAELFNGGDCVRAAYTAECLLNLVFLDEVERLGAAPPTAVLDIPQVAAECRRQQNMVAFLKMSRSVSKDDRFRFSPYSRAD